MDLIPDFIISFGFIDDFTVLSLFFNKYSKEIEKYQIWRESNKIENSK